MQSGTLGTASTRNLHPLSFHIDHLPDSEPPPLASSSPGAERRGGSALEQAKLVEEVHDELDLEGLNDGPEDDGGAGGGHGPLGREREGDHADILDPAPVVHAVEQVDPDGDGAVGAASWGPGAPYLV